MIHPNLMSRPIWMKNEHMNFRERDRQLILKGNCWHWTRRTCSNPTQRLKPLGNHLNNWCRRGRSLYDSMYCNANSTIKNGVSALLFTNKERISLKLANVQMQSRGADCGVFEIAYATVLCLGLQPEQFSFNQELMRSHLLECLEKQMSLFPVEVLSSQLNPSIDLQFSVPVDSLFSPVSA